MPDTSALLFIHAQTSLHPGTGAALGTVDLPIQRERHTGWPMIAGSSLKGVLREHCRPDEADPDFQKWLAVFGPKPNEAELHAGAISITDSRMLAFPVRSANSVFAWVTCPEALGRLARDAKLASEDVPAGVDTLIDLGATNGIAFTPSQSPLLITEEQQKRLLLEEYDFTVDPASAGCAVAAKVAEWIANHAVGDDFTRSRLRSHLVILSDTEFTHFVRHATEVTARIGLNYETKTVSGGALFYEEFLPAETLMYAVVLASPSRRKFDNNDRPGRQSTPMSGSFVLQFVTSRLADCSILQIGANETIGKGLCAVRINSRDSQVHAEATP